MLYGLMVLALLMIVWLFTRDSKANFFWVFPIWACCIYLVLKATGEPYFQIALETLAIAVLLISIARALKRAH
jgi:uncharacterized membrane protein YbhN (UPF0104 family)